MQVITFHNEKGGVGKTTLTAFTALGLAAKGYRVATIDTDGQASLTSAFGLQEKHHFVYWARSGDDFSLRDLLTPLTGILAPDSGPLFHVCGSSWSASVADGINRDSLVKSMRARLQQMSRAFDYVLFDTQPSLTMLHDVMLYLTDWYVIPTEAEPLAIKGVYSTIEHITANREQILAYRPDWRKTNILAVVPNIFRTHTVLHQQYDRLLREDLGDLVWEAIPQRIEIAEGTADQRFVFIKQLVRMIDRIEKETAREQA